MRSFYNLNRLSADRIAKLDASGMEWSRGGRSAAATTTTTEDTAAADK